MKTLKINLSIREIDKLTGITKWITDVKIDGNYKTYFSRQTQTMLIVSENLQIFSIEH